MLLTGSNGFIGRRIAADAAARGWQVVAWAEPQPSTDVAEYVFA